MKKIVMRVNGKTAGVTLETSGFKGPECMKETADIERAIGRTTSNEKTREFYTTSSQTESQQLRQ